MRIASPLGSDRQVHILHIGKTGGVAIRRALTPVVHEGKYEIIFHDHHTTLRGVPRRAWFGFSIRDPIDRFVSGFYSRQRRGRPRFNKPWSKQEERAFGRFLTANGLGEALSSDDDETRQAAEDAMRSIEHVRDSYWRWFRNERYFLSRMAKLLFILHQARLDEEFPRVVERLGLDPAKVILPGDEVAAHKNASPIDRNLTPIARRNLRNWYSSDYEFVALCEGLDARRRDPS
jgi:hypothetical protein